MVKERGPEEQSRFEAVITKFAEFAATPEGMDQVIIAAENVILHIDEAKIGLPMHLLEAVLRSDGLLSKLPLEDGILHRRSLVQAVAGFTVLVAAMEIGEIDLPTEVSPKDVILAVEKTFAIQSLPIRKFIVTKDGRELRPSGFSHDIVQEYQARVLDPEFGNFRLALDKFTAAFAPNNPNHRLVTQAQRDAFFYAAMGTYLRIRFPGQSEPTAPDVPPLLHFPPSGSRRKTKK